jgi:hypothetical protein
VPCCLDASLHCQGVTFHSTNTIPSAKPDRYFQGLIDSELKYFGRLPLAYWGCFAGRGIPRRSLPYPCRQAEGEGVLLATTTAILLIYPWGPRRSRPSLPALSNRYGYGFMVKMDASPKLLGVYRVVGGGGMWGLMAKHWPSL